MQVIQNSRTFVTIIKKDGKTLYFDSKKKFLYWRKLVNAVRFTYLQETY